MVYVLISELVKNHGLRRLSYYNDFLPADEKDRILKFRNWDDSQRSLLGKLLLIEGLIRTGHVAEKMLEMKRDEFCKPYFSNGPYFNISHSGKYIVCAISNNIPLGIDIEHIKEINIYEMQGQWCEAEWNSIVSSKNSLATFYQFWARKEAIVKADGKGLSMQLDCIDTSSDEVKLNQAWYLKEILVGVEYACYLAVNKNDIELTICKIHF